MTSSEFEQWQMKSFRGHMPSLIMVCARRFADAARLLGIRGKEMDRVREACVGRDDPEPLLAFWRAVCDRYRVERYEPQLGLFVVHDEELRVRWGHFLHCELFPELVQEDEVVRDVLRGVGALPTASVPDTVAALAHHVRQMGSPFGTFEWDAQWRDR